MNKDKYQVPKYEKYEYEPHKVEVEKKKRPLGKIIATLIVATMIFFAFHYVAYRESPSKCPEGFYWDGEECIENPPPPPPTYPDYEYEISKAGVEYCKNQTDDFVIDNGAYPKRIIWSTENISQNDCVSFIIRIIRMDTGTWEDGALIETFATVDLYYIGEWHDYEEQKIVSDIETEVRGEYLYNVTKLQNLYSPLEYIDFLITLRFNNNPDLPDDQIYNFYAPLTIEDDFGYWGSFVDMNFIIIT